MLSKQPRCVRLVRWRTSRGSPAAMLDVSWLWRYQSNPDVCDWYGEEQENGHQFPCLVLKSSFRGGRVEKKGWGVEQERTLTTKKLMLQLDDCRRCAGVAQGAVAPLTVWDNTPETNVQSCECIFFTWRCVLNLSSKEWCDWFSMHGAIVVCSSSTCSHVGALRETWNLSAWCDSFHTWCGCGVLLFNL